jgi:hypothetical protein
LDIRCVRIKPYRDGQRVLVDVQQVLPLPEAQDYTVHLREKAERERLDRADDEARHKLRREFWAGLLDKMNQKSTLFSNIAASKDNWITAGSGVSGLHYCFAVRRYDATVKFLLEGEREKNKAAFDFLESHRAEIEKAFGELLDWERNEDIKQSSLHRTYAIAGIHSDKSDWPKAYDVLIDAMIRLEKAISPWIAGLRKAVPQG